MTFLQNMSEYVTAAELYLIDAYMLYTKHVETGKSLITIDGLFAV